MHEVKISCVSMKNLKVVFAERLVDSLVLCVHYILYIYFPTGNCESIRIYTF